MANELDSRILSAFPGGFDLSAHTICAAQLGCDSTGQYSPLGDLDDEDRWLTVGVVVPPTGPARDSAFLEPWAWQSSEPRVELFSLRKLVGHLLEADPNSLALVWLPPSAYVLRTTPFDRLLAHRDVFSSRIACNMFTSHASMLMVTAEMPASGRYMGAKRKALVECIGYDAKSAAHGIRLLRMGVEFLETGRLQVFRQDDAEEIRSIKRGEWSLERVKEEAERGFARAREARDRSPLPEQPDLARAEQLLLDITLDVWRANGEV